MSNHNMILWRNTLEIRHEIFKIFGRFQIFSFQIFVSKVVGFHLKVTKTLFGAGGLGGFRLFMACFRFFHAELSLMPEKHSDSFTIWAYGSWDSLFPISMSPNCKLMSPEHYFNDNSAILLHPGTC